MYTIVHAIIILGSEDIIIIINTAVNHELIIIVGIVAALLSCIHIWLLQYISVRCIIHVLEACMIFKCIIYTAIYSFYAI